jgi:hypothetical protein
VNPNSYSDMLVNEIELSMNACAIERDDMEQATVCLADYIDHIQIIRVKQKHSLQYKLMPWVFTLVMFVIVPIIANLLIGG